MKNYRKAKKTVDVSVGEYVRIMRELQELSQSELAQQAFVLGSNLLAEKRSAFIKQWREYWLSAMPVGKAA